LDKRRLRRNWHQLRTSKNKRLLNAAARELKQLLNNNRNHNIQTFLKGLALRHPPTIPYGRRSKTKQITKSSPPLRTTQGTWARSDIEKANTFAENLANVFQLHRSENAPVGEKALTHYLETPYQLEPPLNRLLRSKVHAFVKNLIPKKSPGYDLITGKILKKLPVVGIQYLTQIFNAVMPTGHFPAQWKVAQVILILKPGKPPNEPTSYRQISLLPILSKVFEKLLLNRLIPFIVHRNLIPNHQFGFRRRHSTIHQRHRIVHKINEALNDKLSCSAAFLDISQAFDKV
jgi:hypothetical protein